ncbi:MAG: hypothetical protein WCE30_04800 [Mycobacterium sp.]
MSTLNLRTVGIAVTAALLTAGCGTQSDNAPVTPAPASSGTPQMSDQQAPPQRLVIDATIKGGQVIPNGKQLKATVNETIVVRISSDADDELQVNSTPEHKFTVTAKPNQSFQFSIGTAGKVDITLKTLNKTIATVDVQ